MACAPEMAVSRPILVIGDLGLWHGRVSGYKEIPSGKIRDCLYSDCDYSTILDFLDNLGEENYISESITEDGEPDIRGGYYFGFARRITYDLYGDPVDLDTVMSGNRRRRFFGRRR